MCPTAWPTGVGHGARRPGSRIDQRRVEVRDAIVRFSPSGLNNPSHSGRKGQVGTDLKLILDKRLRGPHPFAGGGTVVDPPSVWQAQKEIRESLARAAGNR